MRRRLGVLRRYHQHHCERADPLVQYEHRAFAMDQATGKFYLAFRNLRTASGVVGDRR
ncbi:MAG: hypothetical protein IPN77_15425 [Sandaracinaceae bacterium]|nr:hypothetical protein [Sandaracinaceae bacterium]